MTGKTQFEERLEKGDGHIDHYYKHEQNDYYTVVLQYNDGSHQTYANISKELLDKFCDISPQPEKTTHHEKSRSSSKTRLEEELESGGCKIAHSNKHEKNDNYVVVLEYDDGSHKSFPNITPEALKRAEGIKSK